MALPDEIARDLVIAWLSHNDMHFNFENAAQSGEDIGKIYIAVYQAVREAMQQPAR